MKSKALVIVVATIIITLTWAAPYVTAKYTNNSAGTLDPLVIGVVDADSISSARLTVDPGPFLVGNDASTVDAPKAKAIFSQSDTSGAYAGFSAALLEASAGTTTGGGFEAATIAASVKSNGANSASAVLGSASATNTGDTGDLIGIQGLTSGAHAGGTSYGVYSACLATGAECFSYYSPTGGGELYNVQDIWTDGTVNVFRGHSGDESADTDMLALRDGSTVEMKLWFDDNILTLKSTVTVDAPAMKTININASGAVFSVTFQPNTSGIDWIGRIRSDTKDYLWQDKDSYTVKSLDPVTGTLALHGGDSNDYGHLTIGDGATVTAQFGEGVQFNYTTAAMPGATVSYSTLATDHIIGVTHGGTAVRVVLETDVVASAGWSYVVKDVSGTGGSATIRVATEGAELIDGATYADITTNFATLEFISTGIGWMLR